MICINFVIIGKYRGNYLISFIKGCLNFKIFVLKDYELLKLYIDVVVYFKVIVKIFIINCDKVNIDFF